MFSGRKIFIFLLPILLGLASAYLFRTKSFSPVVAVTPTLAVITVVPTITPTHIPKIISIDEGPLKDSVIAAGDYLVRQQLTNGELSYQVDIFTGERAYSPSYLRLVAGTGSLFTVCRVSDDPKYCIAGDSALEHYLEFLVSDPKKFKGTCLYTDGSCQLSGSALTVDTIYKRWQATDGFFLTDQNLLETASELGYFIVSMRKPEGGFYHLFDPHLVGEVKPDYFSAFASSEALLALTELYEMTNNVFWLAQAREVNAYMITQPVTEDYWHSYFFSMLARLDHLNKADKEYAVEIAKTIIVGQVRSLDPKNTSIATATKVESLAALAQAFYLSGAEHEWLDPEIRTFITFVQARQLPDNNCNWEISKDMITRYGGGIFSSCDDASIRIDGLQHWINGVTAYLEYQSMINSDYAPSP
ncbi:MAG: hypothetical protein NTW69_03365 [Chloroflexi bacterium]|nr:hypothetical protein [Chloroflexota bacterium]